MSIMLANGASVRAAYEPALACNPLRPTPRKGLRWSRQLDKHQGYGMETADRPLVRKYGHCFIRYHFPHRQRRPGRQAFIRIDELPHRLFEAPFDRSPKIRASLSRGHSIWVAAVLNIRHIITIAAAAVTAFRRHSSRLFVSASAIRQSGSRRRGQRPRTAEQRAGAAQGAGHVSVWRHRRTGPS
jgi:hypothetical protein